MEEIKTSRVKGRLDLDEYFHKRLNRDWEDLEELESAGIIETETSGRSDKFWILSEEGERIALFKITNWKSDEDYAELLGEEIAKALNMETAHYDLAKFSLNKGVISYNFLEPYETLYAGTDIIFDFYEEKLEDNEELQALYGLSSDDTIDDACTKLNNLEDLWSILEDKYKNDYNKSYIIKRIMDGLIDKLIFDILTVNVDDHVENWAIKGGRQGKELTPVYDHGRILNLHMNVAVENSLGRGDLTQKELLLKVDNSNTKKPLEVLDKFLHISSSEYVDYVKEKVELLQERVEVIPKIVEERTCYPMSDYIKNYFVTSCLNHLNEVSEVVNKYDRKHTK